MFNAYKYKNIVLSLILYGTFSFCSEAMEDSTVIHNNSLYVDSEEDEEVFQDTMG